MAKLTKAQVWALRGIATGEGQSPAELGEYMMERPGVEEHRRGGNRNSRQAHGRIGGTMMHRLERLGLVSLRSSTFGQWHATRAELTAGGRAALAEHSDG